MDIPKSSLRSLQLLLSIVTVSVLTSAYNDYHRNVRWFDL